MTWAIYQVADHRFGLALVRAESAEEALDSFMEGQKEGAKWHGIAPEPRSKFLAIPTKIDQNEEAS